MNMLLWSTDVSDPSYAETFEMLRDAGYEGIEVPVFDPDPRKAERIGERLRELALTPLGVTARSEAQSPISEDADVRREAVFSGRGPSSEEQKRSAETLHAASEYAAGRDVTLVVEYLNRFELYLVNCAADAASLVREVGHPNCRLMYDTFHAHIEEKNPRAALRECADVLVHVHASENDRGTPGSGQVDWDGTFAGLDEIGYDGWIVVEAFSDALPELAAATKVWRRTFESEEQLARDAAVFLRGKLAS
jgi:D-psicose/D-tagatose/L-ribulose 3-epimerase